MAPDAGRPDPSLRERGGSGGDDVTRDHWRTGRTEAQLAAMERRFVADVRAEAARLLASGEVIGEHAAFAEAQRRVTAARDRKPVTR